MTYEPLRAFEDYRWGETNRTSVAFRRLRWQIKANTTIAESVHVLRDVTDPESAQDSFIDAGGNFHRVASASVFAAPVSSVQARLHVLDGINLYGDPSDDDDEDEDDETLPWKGPELAVRPTSGAFVTIGDFVMAVHPWLLEKRGEILKETANKASGYSGQTIPDNTEFWIDPSEASPMYLLNSSEYQYGTFEEHRRTVAKNASRLLQNDDDDVVDEEGWITYCDGTLDYAKEPN